MQEYSSPAHHQCPHVTRVPMARKEKKSFFFSLHESKVGEKEPEKRRKTRRKCVANSPKCGKEIMFISWINSGIIPAQFRQVFITLFSAFFHLNVNRSYVPSFISYSKVCRMKRMMSLALTTEKEREGATNLERHFGPTTALIVKLLFLFCDCLAYFYCFTPYPFLSFFQEVLNSW